MPEFENTGHSPLTDGFISPLDPRYDHSLGGRQFVMQGQVLIALDTPTYGGESTEPSLGSTAMADKPDSSDPEPVHLD